jgi:hypothetical protein
MFYDAFTKWVYGDAKDANSPRTAFYFEAFDEPWKNEDDNWGLFDVNRKAKYVLWSAFPDLKPADAPSYTEQDAVYYIAPPPVADAGEGGVNEAGASEGGSSDAGTTDASEAASSSDGSPDSSDAAPATD